MRAPGSTGDGRIEALHAKAARLHKERRFADEATVWREICEIEPNSPFWLHNLALALLHSDQFDECLPLFASLLKEAPTLSRVHNNFAMAALRLGVPPKFVVPHFIQALAFSEDADEFYRHLLNACNSVVYGFDDPTEADAVLDVLADCVLRLIEQRSEPEYRHNNRGYLTRLIDVYRHMAQFRSFFAHAEWALAKGELDLARRGFRQMGLENAVRGLTSIQVTFELARSISAYVENTADGRYKELAQHSPNALTSKNNAMYARINLINIQCSSDFRSSSRHFLMALLWR